ncbi:NAD(P)-dependent dehydrogenase (short-subunit alcohol dehydrogenase family) [Rhodobacter aestuarii]|uniref:NAD(P)-dependent dehydrogenase, short-chain alcohol dehydrogenase family n=1 Tax=Rhodobacter aestuarii TaxID=453582 RepID=A0A1N7NNL7_9RHOB|nr:SDR family NAD(P)-dependent oxidoreductase [Rhodobacter aestuarii]PTV94659.1 NAD(P)-dependent dehydrogenase (short-subunit alcohol dehydrogenase family) [Rhodobacter aestuarii]SIS99880.1 NAD(P)-dependent dehydrogenase, short-chain alcohol dehydrogenase family [Rhodobacter aestuarii]
MTDQPKKKLALVTGASRGLGFAIAEELGKQGWHVMAVARTVGGLEALDDRIQAAGGSATLAPLDITKPEEMLTLAQGIATRWGGADLWVHAAIHAAPLCPTGHIDAEDVENSVNTNYVAVTTLIPLVEPLLRAVDGTAVFFDDDHTGQPFWGSYGATKAAQMSLVRGWQAETAKIGPKVVIAQPQPMETAVRARFYPVEDRDPLHDCHEEARRILAEVL